MIGENGVIKHTPSCERYNSHSIQILHYVLTKSRTIETEAVVCGRRTETGMEWKPSLLNKLTEGSLVSKVFHFTKVY
jgi:hypothetical protein